MTGQNGSRGSEPVTASLVRVDPRWPGAWAKLAGYLGSALERGGDKDWNLEDMRQAVVEGRVALWGLVRCGYVFGSLVTCMTSYPRRQVLEVLAMGADKGHELHWNACLEELMGHARAAGATAIVGTGRPGWARKLGAEERRVFELDLSIKDEPKTQ